MVYSHRSLDATFSALADPTRRDILARLAAGDRTIGELASRFTMSLPAVSKHVRVLQRAGLATVEKEGRVRRATLHAAPMRDVLAWVARYKQFWETELDLLAAYLENPLPTDVTWPKQPPQKPPRRQSSKSAARSARRGSASTTRGRKKKS
ncbi:MAG TPA: metalloregulator ArsR/SmtB family transcription factor [Gemmatimonadaceae bacterium]|nr:metalloregulator ArsR/SmtB family transcription factor [Gemmatimonadaceae bacterium]